MSVKLIRLISRLNLDFWAGTINEQYAFISSQVQNDADKLIRKIKQREAEMLTTINGLREKAREVIEMEIGHYVQNSSKSVESVTDVITALSELEMAASSKKVVQLPQVNKLHVDFGPLNHQADNLRLEKKIEEPVKSATKEDRKEKTNHHRLPLNHVFQQEVKFVFKLDVSKILLSSWYKVCLKWIYSNLRFCQQRQDFRRLGTTFWRGQRTPHQRATFRQYLLTDRSKWVSLKSFCSNRILNQFFKTVQRTHILGSECGKVKYFQGRGFIPLYQVMKLHFYSYFRLLVQAFET